MNNLKDFFSSKDGAPNIIYKGDVLKKEDTYVKRMVPHLATFVLFTGELIAKRWKRFQRIEMNDYYYMSESYWDAVQFKPKIDVHILGFAVLNQYEKAAWTLTFKWVIGEDSSDEHSVELSTDMCEENIFYLEFSKLGIPPIKLNAETGIHLCAKSRCVSSNRFNYGTQGSDFANIADQEPDFLMEYSPHNQNSTSTDFGQFPYILYAK